MLTATASAARSATHSRQAVAAMKAIQPAATVFPQPLAAASAHRQTNARNKREYAVYTMSAKTGQHAYRIVKTNGYTQ